MKITLEFDPTNPGTVTTTAPMTTPEPTPEKSAEAKAEAEADPAPKPKAMAAAVPIPEEKPAQDGGDFGNMGGICDIYDPQKSNPNVFQFQMPKEG